MYISVRYRLFTRFPFSIFISKREDRSGQRAKTNAKQIFQLVNQLRVLTAVGVCVGMCVCVGCHISGTKIPSSKDMEKVRPFYNHFDLKATMTPQPWSTV